MSFWEKIKQSLRTFMAGRNGADHFSMALLWTGLALYLISSVLTSIQGVPLLNLLGLALNLLGSLAYVYSIFRMFSRNRGQRNLENKRFVQWTANWRKEMKEFFLRVKNLPTYKYFRCPKCSVRLRMKRGSGEKSIHCPKCHHEFTKKA